MTKKVKSPTGVISDLEKRKKLRHNEYYDIQEIFDELYSQSQQGKYFRNLISIMKSKKNIRLAYRNIKRNGGKDTAGVDGITIKDIAKLPPHVIVENIEKMFDFYVPKPVRRKMIPKENGKKRPLGIPCMWDRLFQQCILQVLEPICEARFHNHSYGFRPNRGTNHAIARMLFLINQCGLHHCVDVDIKGFFDNVNHGKLLKQMWTLGIKDKKLLSIISTLVKAEIEGEGIPSKGTPQGGILSPLLSNIVLNELDWWVSNQYETFETKHQYTQSNKFRALKSTKLKEIYIIRYADDFKILCRTRNQAIKTKIAVEKFLKERLQLDCSEDKSKVVNLKKNWSDFLGFQLKVKAKGYKETKQWAKTNVKDENTGKWRTKNYVKSVLKEPKYTCTSRMSPKALKKAKDKITKAIKTIQKSPTPDKAKLFNSTVMGIQNYYKIATNITLNLSEISFHCQRAIYNRLRLNTKQASYKDMTKMQQKRYKGYNPKLISLGPVVLAPIHAQKQEAPMNFNQNISNYTSNGRKLIHNKLMKIAETTIAAIMEQYLSDRSIEYHDNRISKFVGQQGKCYVTGKLLGIIGWHCHHIIPFHKNKDDSYKNLVIVENDIHRLIHMTDEVKIYNLLVMNEIKGAKLKRVNSLREKVGLEPIDLKSIKKNILIAS